MLFQARTMAAAMAIAVALPAAAQASTTETWKASPSNGSTHYVSGTLTYDRGADQVTAANVTVETYNKTYTALGKTDGNLLIVQDGQTTQAGYGVFVINLASLRASATTPVNLPGAMAHCATINQDGACTSVNDPINHIADDNVTFTLQPAPAAVPTLTEWAMILMGTALAGFAALTLNTRRRRA